MNGLSPCNPKASEHMNQVTPKEIEIQICDRAINTSKQKESVVVPHIIKPRRRRRRRQTDNLILFLPFLLQKPKQKKSSSSPSLQNQLNKKKNKSILYPTYNNIHPLPLISPAKNQQVFISHFLPPAKNQSRRKQQAKQKTKKRKEKLPSCKAKAKHQVLGRKKEKL